MKSSNTYTRPPQWLVDLVDPRFWDLWNNSAFEGIEKVAQRVHDIAGNQNEALMRLCHPQRMMLSGGILPLHAQFGDFENVQMSVDVLEQLGRENAPVLTVYSKLYRESQAFANYADKVSFNGSGTNWGHFDYILFHCKWLMKGRKKFQITNALAHLLEKTDFGEDTPSSFFKMPYDFQYIEFGTDRKMEQTISNIATGDHLFEGAYINMFTMDYDAIYAKNYGTIRELKRRGHLRREDGDIICTEFMFTGSPLGKSGVYDDATYSVALFTQDNDVPVMTMVNACLDVDKADFTGFVANYQPSTTEIDNEVRGMVDLMIKAVLYINSDKVDKQDIKQPLMLDNELGKAKGYNRKKKAAKKLAQGLGYTRIGSESYDTGVKTGMAGKGGTVKTHWRRGHFRKQHYGKGNVDIKIVWVKPTLIGSGGAVGGDYKVT